MRFSIRILAAPAVALPVTLSNAPANALPYDPYPGCADYSARNRGGSNCGFLTIEQCWATVSGIGGFCRAQPILQPRANGPDAQLKAPLDP